MSLRGSHGARVDDRNRLKVPVEFRREIEKAWGPSLFVTSLNGKSVSMFPMPVWEEFEARLMGMPLMDPARMRLQKVLNYYGQNQDIDSQGRVLVHSPLKEDAQIKGEVMVLGYGNYLHVENAERIRQDVAASIEADLQTLSDLWRKTT